ncbi:myb-like protein Q [Bactrocera neohumeralis]|uniref:myb-like protein Q n=1 Tax=Bactrocera neohumeralis TaxID=98809 RepID=UPI00216531C4|nr:myb-like protein Q [Bactrocera neohumeralis]
MFADYVNLPPNHAPTYSDVSVNPFSAATGLDMDQYSGAEDRARYPSHMTYPMSPEMGEMDEATNLRGLYPSGGGGGTGWGDDPTGTGGGTGPSGYGYGAAHGGGAGSYGYHPAHAPVHVPTGGSYSHHATAGSGYGGYAPPPPKIYARPHPTVPTKGFKKKHSTSDSNASTMNALTLLAFFFFVNLLQSCLKENMEAMNPTVMVMTTNMVRNRNTKLAEMNSREQSSSPASAFTSGANIVVAPETLVSAGSSSVAAGAPGLASVTLQTSPYSDGGGGAAAGVSSAVNVGNNFAGGAGVASSNNHIGNYNNNNHGGSDNGNRQPGEPQYSYGTNGVSSGQQHHGGAAVIQNQHNQNVHNNNNNQAYGASQHGDTYPFSPTPTIITANRDPRPELYDPPYLYRNQTINSATSLNQQHYYQQQLQQHHQQHQQQRPYPPEQFEEEEYEAQSPQQQPPSQIQQPQQHEHPVHNQFQQQQQYHENRPNDNYAHQQQQTDHHEEYHEHHHNQQPVALPPHDHFQHHYPAHHPQQQSSFQSHQHQSYASHRRPSPPNRGYSEASHPWSYSPASSPFRRGSSNSPLSSYTWSSDSSKGHVSGNNNFGDLDDDDDRRYEDSFYTRSERKL